MGCRDIGEQPAAAAAGVQQTGTAQAGEHRGVEPPPLALADERAIPVEPKPAQIIQDRGFRVRAVARRIEIVDAKEPLPPLQAGDQPREQGCAQVAQVQGPRGGRGIATTVVLPAQPLTFGQQPLQMLGKGDRCHGDQAATQQKRRPKGRRWQQSTSGSLRGSEGEELSPAHGP